MGDKLNQRTVMTDSGLGSFGSESDTSPGPGAPSLGKTQGISDVPENLSMQNKINDCSPLPQGKRFHVHYFGNLEIDKRYIQAQFWKIILQWIVAEIKRKFVRKSISLEIQDGLLIGKDDQRECIIDHDLHQISKFSRTHLDTTCFAYVTRNSEYSYVCHLYKTDHEDMVQDIFRTIRDASKCSAKDAVFQNLTKQIIEGHQHDQQNHVSLFEVLYVGKVVVSNKKTHASFIDDAVEKFKLYEEQKEQEAERRRRSSGQSVRSLPGNLEKSVNIKENELKASNLETNQNQSNDSVSSTGSDHDISTGSVDIQMPDHASGVYPADATKLASASNSEESVDSLHSDIHIVDAQGDAKVTPRTSENLQRSVLENQSHAKKNRTMLLQISKNEVSLISPDRKRTSLKKNFKDISFCTRGIRHTDYFGFITRENETAAFVCYVFMCALDSVTEDIMQTLKVAFEAAFNQSARTHMCELCPMHQLQRVGEEIDKLQWEQMLEILTRRIEQLSETDQEEFQHKLKDEEIGSTQEQMEVSMMVLRHMCEQRQIEHVHISDTNKNLVTRYEFTLSESAKNRHSTFDDLRYRAKKSLTESFETLKQVKERVRHKSGDAIRNMRSQSTDSEAGEPEVHQPEQVTSPASVLKGFFFPTSPTPNDQPILSKPVSDAESRPRSSTNPASIIQQMRDRHRSIPENDDDMSASTTKPSPLTKEFEMLTIKKINDGLKEMTDDKTDMADEEVEDTEQDKGEKKEGDGEKEEISEEVKEVVQGVVKADLHRYDSPLKSMFLKAGNKEIKTPSPLASGPSKTPSSKPPLKRAGSWRLNILTRVVTPAKIPTRSHSAHEPGRIDEDPLPPSLSEKALDRRISSQRCRVLWKKAILETLLFIRMKKEMKSLQTRHEDTGSAPHKLDYEEITPCLKQVTKVWTQMLATPDRHSHKFDYSSVEQAVKDGVPRVRRGEIWQLLVEQHKIRHPSTHTMTELRAPYEDLLKQLTTHQHAILIDLGRTFPNSPYFSTQLGAGQLALFNILKAYSLLDKEVGYCQGLSFVAGVLLMHMTEGVAFEVMRYMMFALGFRRQYRPDMVALQIQMYQLSRLLHDNHRDLYDHFELHEIAPTLYAAPWFLTMFASQFPLGFVARVFDVIMLQGSCEVVLKVALVVLGNHKELIKNCTTFEGIVAFLKTTLPEMGIIQMERVFNQVFAMDISKQLHAYEVEYHVLQEEMVTTPQRGETDVVPKLEAANHSLKRQNLELLEQLQIAHSHNHSLDVQVHNLQSSSAKLKKHIRTLEIERSALLNTMSRIRQFVPEDTLKDSGIVIPSIPSERTFTLSPIHNPMGASAPSAFSSLDSEVAELMGDMSPLVKARKSDTLLPPKPPSRIRRPSSSEN